MSDWLVAKVESVPYEGHHDVGPNAFIQWKGTDVCFDFWCECGSEGHFDGLFAHNFLCPTCSAIWAMPSTIYPLRTDDPAHDPVVLDIEETP